MERAMAELLAQRDMHQILMRYCRAIDRCDEALLSSCYHDDATFDYGDNRGKATDFVKTTITALRSLAGTLHSVSNYYFLEQDETTARVESYCYAYHRLANADGDQDMIVGGRYLDNFANKQGSWRIQHRVYVMDWNQNAASTALWDRGMYAGLTNRGKRFPDDPSYLSTGGEPQ